MRRKGRIERGVARRRRPGILPAVLALWLAALPPANAAFGQSGEDTLRGTRDRVQDVERAREDLEALERARRALDGAPEEPVRFADILKNPDDIALNFAYARQQVAQGRLKAAATTLERILLIEPDLHEVRLFYALVLLRLDSLQSAARELDRLAGLEMTPELRAELEALRTAIEDRRQRLTASLLIGVGANYDWNVNGVPADRLMLFGGASVRLDEQSDRVGDFSYTGFKRWEAAYDLGLQARHELIGSATLFVDDQVNYDQQDAWSYAVDAGMTFRLPDLTLTPKAFFSRLRLSHERFYRGAGAELDFRYTLPPDGAVVGGLTLTHEAFERTSENITAVDDSGVRFGGDLGLEADLDARNQLLVSYDAFVKYGVYSDDHYWGHGVTGRYTRLFDGGKFLSGSLALKQRVDFRADPSVDPGRTRRDETVRAGLRAGAPLGTLLDLSSLPEPVSDIFGPAVATAQVEAFRSMSNIRNYQYWNRRASLLLTRRWQF
jgi:tetratricopeptide (TPR) repeat protein